MDLFTKIVEVYPELKDSDFRPTYGLIELRDDGDGVQYIAKWEYSKSIPAGLSVGKN